MKAIIDIVSQVVHVSLLEDPYPNNVTEDAAIAAHAFVNDLVKQSVYKTMRAYEGDLDIGIRIAFGGEIFKNAVLIDETVIHNIEALIDYAPSYILLVLNVIHSIRKEFPKGKMIAFFETAYFMDLPLEEQLYAVSQEYLQAFQLRRRGFNGLFHGSVAAHFSTKKCISIVLDKKTTICAMDKGKPKSISLGYTPLEGVMGRTSCGDLDPGIVLQYMKDSQCSVFAIDDILKNKSGFVGLTGYDLSMQDFVRLWGRDKKVDFAFDLYQNHILKYIGEAITVLGSVDLLVFSGAHVPLLIPIVISLLHKIRFLGISLRDMPVTTESEYTDLTRHDSSIRVCFSATSLPGVMCELMNDFGK
jgi:acetate kinase